MCGLWKNFSRVFFLLVLTFGGVVSAETSVWKASKGKNTVYLAGTFHLLNAEDHPLPAEFDKAYNAADEVFFETDISAANTPEFQMKFMQAMSLSGGKTLETSLKPETYLALSEFMLGRELAIENFSPFSPAGVGLVLTVMEYQRLGMSPNHGVDAYFNEKAIVDKKSIGQLESVDAQIAFLANMGKGQEDEMVMYSLRELQSAESSLQDLKKYWREGKNKELDKLALKDMREKFKGTYDELIVTRNNNWLPQIEEMLADNNTEVVMVGALHLAGPDGLLTKLSALGYDIEQL